MEGRISYSFFDSTISHHSPTRAHTDPHGGPQSRVKLVVDVTLRFFLLGGVGTVPEPDSGVSM